MVNQIRLCERICCIPVWSIGLVATLGQLAVLPTPTTLVDIQFAVWATGLTGGAIILIKILPRESGLLNRPARAITALAAILRHPTVASQLVLVSLLQLLGFSAIFRFSRRAMHIPPSRAYNRAFRAFYLLALFVANLLPSMGGEKPYYWWNGNCIERPVDRVVWLLESW